MGIEVAPGTYSTKQKIGANQSQVNLNGKWYVTTLSKKATTPTGTNPLGVGAGMSIPPDIAKQYNIPADTQLYWTPPPGKGPPTAPGTGRELYDAIGQSKLPKAAKQAIIRQVFGPGFSPSVKHASTIFEALSTAFAYNGYSFNGLTAPQIASSVTAAKAQIVQNQVLVNQFDASMAQSAHATALGVSQAKAGQEASAFDQVANTLDQWHLGAVAPYVLQMVLRNGDHVTNINAILDAVRGQAPSGLGATVDDKFKDAYDQAFPGLSAYNAKPGVHYSEQQYMTYSSSIKDAAAQYGGVNVTQAEVGKLLQGHVSAPEFTQRVQDIGAAVRNADPYTKQLLKQQYGITDANLFHYYANGKNALPEMQRAVASAETQDYAKRVGLSGVGQTSGEQLGDMAKLAATQGNNPLGVGVNQIEGALLNASRDVALTSSQPGAGTPTVNTNTLIGSQLAGFAGTNQVQAQTQVARAEQAKAAPFDKGGGFESDAHGVVGIGSART